MAARLLGPPAASTNPRMNALIIVEGFNDCFAVHRAVQAPVRLPYAAGGRVAKRASAAVHAPVGLHARACG